MIKRYYLILQKFFSLKAHDNRLVFHLFFSALLRSISLLLIPVAAAKVVEFATIKDYQTTFLYATIFLIVSFIYVLCHHYNYIAYKNNSIFTHNKLQELILSKVTSYDENFTKNMSTSYIVNTAFNDVGKVMQVPDQSFDAITGVVNIAIALIILISVNVYIGILALILYIISMYALDKNMKKKNYYLSRQRKHQDNISSLMGQVLDGNKEIKAFNMSDNLNTYLENYKKLWKKDYFKKRKYNDNFYVLVPTILGFGKIAIYLILIYLILNGRYDVATLVLVVGYYENIENEFKKLYSKLDNVSSFSIMLDRIYKILNYKTSNMLSFGDNDNDYIKGKINFKNVSFTYEKQVILKNVSFEIKPQSFTAIVGKSGSGKSTIFRLLLRLYKADKGTILLDDESIYDYTREVYSSNVSIVTQKPFIFDMSIRENFNLVDSNHSHQIEACKRVGIHDYIMSLKDGYNTKLVADAENISNGQKQLIALARTLLSKSEVLLFDEVTSSLDINTSKHVMEILKDLKRDHTILMITHKPSLMKLADDIIVIDHGRLVGRGSHKTLLKDNTYYKLLQK
ncbi:MAG: ABC transporter ATP-binding protein [Clostridium sp.]|jgi:lipid A export ATP-binding/permease protein msbA|nr:ABC transporter ATP-binding protein [Clostridium sp.]MEE0092122.1 ABC transporter ATP-binding protein [Bacilli bacterium]